MKEIKKHIKPTVTVFVSALNEEKNISAFISSVLDQIESNYELKNIWIYSDGSTDKTVQVAQEYKDPRVHVFAFKNRAGKANRLAQAYKKLETDFVVQSDADTVLSHKTVISELIQPMITDHTVAVCGGNPTSIKPSTFTEQAIDYTHQAYQTIKNTLKNGNSVFTVGGALIACRKDFVRSLNIPQDIMAEDVYLYFSCLQKNLKYRYVSSAIATIRLPQNIQDHIKQNTRFLASEDKMLRYFPERLVKEESHLPRAFFFSTMIRMFLQHPIHCLYIFILNKYCALKARKLEKDMNSIWNTAQSTKLHITATSSS